MEIIYILLCISVIVAIVFFVAFLISVGKGQYDDTYTPSIRMLFEDEIVKEKPNTATKTTSQKSIIIKDQSN